MSATERDNIIKQGVQIRRNTYRGKDITKYLKDGSLFTMIEKGTFADIYVGDYIISEHNDAFNGKIVWLIADLDNYLRIGDQGNVLQQHHATIIPSYKLDEAQMNSTNITKGGYKASEMYQKTLDNVYKQYIAPDFCSNDSNCHIIEYRNLVTSAVDDSCSNMFGQGTGASSAFEWQSRKLDLMSEVNVYGSIIWSSSGFDIGIDNHQYAIFQLRPELIFQGITGIPTANSDKYFYWLKAVSTSTYFALVHSDGNAGAGSATDTFGIRPRFLID